MTKVEMAREIFNNNKQATRQQVIEMFIADLKMSKAGATTYYYNVSKGAEPKVKVAKKAAKKVARKAVEDKPVQSKEERLEIMRNVGQRIKKYEIPTHDEVTQKYLDEVDEYARSQGPESFLRHLGVR